MLTNFTVYRRDIETLAVAFYQQVKVPVVAVSGKLKNKMETLPNPIFIFSDTSHPVAEIVILMDKYNYYTVKINVLLTTLQLFL